MRIKSILFLTFFLFFFLQKDGKSAVLFYNKYKLHSNDKTQHIIKNIKLDTLCIINPIVFDAFVNRETIEKFNDSLFNTHIDTYSEESLGEENLSLCSHRYLDNYFEDVPHFFLPTLSLEDSNIINDELEKYDTILRIEKLDSLPVSDKLFNVLVKYPAHQYLLTKINYYFNFYRDKTGKNNTHFIRIQVFIIDTRNKSVCFYNSGIWANFIKRKFFKKVLRVLKDK